MDKLINKLINKQYFSVKMNYSIIISDIGIIKNLVLKRLHRK